MFMQMKLRTKLIGSFVIMGVIVLVVGAVGRFGSSRLTERMYDISEDGLQNIVGLWQVNEGQTQIQSAERLLFDVNSTEIERQAALTQIKDAWKQIEAGFKRYEIVARTPEEEALYQKFLQDWKNWEQAHKDLLRLEAEFHQQNIRNPWAAKAELLEQGKANSPEMARVNKALTLRLIMDRDGSTKEEPLFEKADEGAATLLEYNLNNAEKVKQIAEQEANQSNFLIIMGMIFGPVAAVGFGIIISQNILNPINKVVTAISSSSSEISATIEQQERSAIQQATSVNQTTTTMDELGASSRQSAEQAEGSAAGAQQVLILVDGRTQEGQTNQSSLREKVGDIASQILRLSEQTNQIGTISILVSDLANQTNMLALNAAVEAVRAGEHGKGFAVVAAEIRKLADQSKKSAEKINALVADIQSSTNSTVMVTDEGTKTVEKIVDAMKTIALSGQQISLNSNQQMIAVQQVVAAMNSLNIAARETASGISQIKVGTQRLNDAAQDLKSIV
jgi:methyl-accepting chemotaxis protein